MTATRVLVVAVAALVIWAGAARAAQRRGGAGARGQGAPPPTPKSDPAIDLTGTWTAVITEDWTLRMVTPKKGDYTRVPMRSEEHTSELQSRLHLVCRLLLEKKKKTTRTTQDADRARLAARTEGPIRQDT